MAVNGDHNLVHRHTELAGGGGNNPQVGLVWHQPVNVGFFHLVGFEGFIDDPAQGVYRHLEHFVTLHLHKRLAGLDRVEVVGDTAGHVQQLFIAAIGVQVGGQNAGFFTGLQNHRASAFLLEPVRMNFSAVARAYTKPLHTAWISNAGQPSMPSRACRIQAQLGKTLSGVVVANTIRSMSLASMPAASMALRAACSARSTVVWPGRAIWRCSMPVRSRIHWSEVSTRCSRSLLVTMLSGR